MFIDTPLPRQLERQHGDRLRVLIVGAGVAGVTLAQLLRVEGLNPVLIERARDHADAGYMLALMPLVDPALTRLDAQDAYRAHSVRFHRYRLHGRHGQMLREYEIDTLLSEHGDYRGIERGHLLQVVSGAGAPVAYATTMTAIRESADGVHATLQDASGAHEALFDAVVLADGLHSSTRAMVLRPEQVATYDTNWGGWVVWIDSDRAHADQGDEVWGTDFFLGIYPVKGRAGVFVGGDRSDTGKGPQAFIAHIRGQLRIHDAWLDRALTGVGQADAPYFWALTDCRSDAWVVGRVALVGDAAAGFLPTAGVGAGMAMESAGVLARRLAPATPESVGEALREYARVQRPRVEAAQDNSRQLARIMFHRSRVLAAVRDVAARVVSIQVALGPIRHLLESAPAERPV